MKDRRIANVRVWGLPGVIYHWDAEVNGLTCHKDAGYSTVRSAKRSALNWCERTGLIGIVSVDEDCE